MFLSFLPEGCCSERPSFETMSCCFTAPQLQPGCGILSEDHFNVAILLQFYLVLAKIRSSTFGLDLWNRPGTRGTVFL